jgi:ATP-binding cassette subfamily B protein
VKREGFRRVLDCALRYKGKLLGACVCAFLAAALTLWAPALAGEAVDALAGEFSPLARLCGVFVLVCLLAALFQRLFGRLANALSQSVLRDLRRGLFHKFGKLPLSRITADAQGDLAARLAADADAAAEGLLQGALTIFSGAFSMLGALFFMFRANWLAALAAAALTPLSVLAAGGLARASRDAFREQARLQGEMNAFVLERLSGADVLRAFGAEARQSARFREINGRLRIWGRKAQFRSSLANPCARFVNALVFAAAGVTGARLAAKGALSVGALSAFLIYAAQYTKPVNEAAAALTQLAAASAAARRVFDTLDAPEEEDAGAETPAPENCAGNVEFRDVSFSYDKEKPLLAHLNLTVPSGVKAAIVGETGAGKTTLANLLLRFYEVDSGQILIDGADIKTFSRESLSKLFGVVPQDAFLFEGSVRENIAFGRPAAADAEIERAARRAGVHPLLEKLPQGYETYLRADSGELSEGQKQLLCVARAMLTGAPVMLLDEATSAVDEETEARLYAAFDETTRGKTSFVVAHRLSTIQNAGVILVMQNGAVAEQGTHEALLAEKGLYWKFIQSNDC